MRAEYIKAEPFFFKEILDIQIEKGMNDHGGGSITGFIRTEDEETYSSCPIGNTPVILKAVDEEGEERTVFYGILTDSNITRHNSQLQLRLQFTAYTRLMDLSKHMRAFQDGACTYGTILSCLCSVYKDSAFIMQSGFSGVPIQELVVQYQETDWEFLVRLASHFHAPVIPDYLTQGVKFYFGLPSRQAEQEAGDREYRLEKSPLTHQYKTENGITGTGEYDDMAVILQSRDLWEIGDRLLFEDRPYVVSRSASRLDGHQLVNTYVLITENGLKTPKLYNEALIGASIDGLVQSVKGSAVTVHMGIEDVQPGTRWYPYATVFSSPDGSGWYCMPQAGDEIRLYFPTRSEKHAYAISSVHKPVIPGAAAHGQEAPRSNPAANELRSPDGKVVQLLEDRIVLSDGKGNSVVLVDSQGIGIASSGAVSLETPGTISINGDTISLAGSTSVSITAGGGTSGISLTNETVVVSGSNVKVQ